MILRPAVAAEAPALSELAIRSKGHWGYDQAFLDACRRELTVDPKEIEPRRVVVADHGGRPVGFCGLAGEPPEGELGYLLVEPAWIGRGLGRLLWSHIRTSAQRARVRANQDRGGPWSRPFLQGNGCTSNRCRSIRVNPGPTAPLLVYRVSS